MISTLTVKNMHGDDLPSLGGLFGASDPDRPGSAPRSLDDCWKEELGTRIIPNLFDRKAPADKPRSFELKLVFAADATLQSCKVEAAIKTILVPGRPPGPMRLVYREQGGSVQVAQTLTTGILVTVLPDNGFKYLSDPFWEETA